MAIKSQDGQPMPTTQMPEPAQGADGSSKKWAGLAIALVVVIAAAGFMFKDNFKGVGQVLGADTSYQAVFLTNGQVYFGKLSVNGDWMQLKDIYYLQVTQQLQPAGDDGDDTGTPAAQPNIQLVKLGSELHGPEDVMNIEKDKILFWENMKDDSKVVEAIKKYQGTK